MKWGHFKMAEILKSGEKINLIYNFSVIEENNYITKKTATS